MIYPKKNIVVHYFFQLYVRFIVGRHFKEIIYNSIKTDPDKAVLLVANHSGFWDGFLLYWVKRKLFKKRFYIMLLEATSKRVPILKYGGAFSVNKQSRDIVQSLDYAARLLNDPDNLVLIFPQGKLYSNFVTEIEFEKGIIKIMKQAAGNFQLIFAATFIEHFANPKPDAYIYLKSVTGAGFNNIDDLQQAYQQHYNQARQQQTQITK